MVRKLQTAIAREIEKLTFIQFQILENVEEGFHLDNASN